MKQKLFTKKRRGLLIVPRRLWKSLLYLELIILQRVKFQFSYVTPVVSEPSVGSTGPIEPTGPSMLR